MYVLKIKKYKKIITENLTKLVHMYPIRQNQAKYQIRCDEISSPQDFIRRILVLLYDDLTNFFMFVLCKNRAKIAHRINDDFSVKWRCE